MKDSEMEVIIDFHKMPKDIGEIVAHGIRIYNTEDVQRILEWIDKKIENTPVDVTVTVVGKMPNYVAAKIGHYLTGRVGKFVFADPSMPKFEVFDERAPEVRL